MEGKTVKIAVIGDPHLGCTMYTDKRISDFSKQFNRSIEEALERKVKAIFILGDVFDSSAYRRSVDNFAACVGQIGDSFVKLREAGVKVFVIGGNHEYGRGRTGGELRMLSDLKIVNFLDDKAMDFDGYNIAGISWKSDPESFRQTLKKLGKPTANSILLMHQFCEGSRLIPAFITEIGREELKDWPTVFTGHHHQYEDLGYVVAPGSLEVHSAKEVGRKGFIIYDTDTRKHEFIVLPPSRDIRYTVISGNGKSAKEFQQAIEGWIQDTASRGSLLVIRVDGTLASGRSIDVDWRYLRSIGYQSGCLKIYFEGGLRDQVRTAPEIRATVNFQDFIKKRFGSRQEQAVKYVEAFREKGDEFSTEILDGILEEVERGGKK
jgi:DNA repair exonuclease SbcCD nuclease subunit